MGRLASRDPGQRGSVSAEALILLPFFFIVWAALFFSYRLQEKKAVVNEISRECSWERMSAGCSAPPSPRCNYSQPSQLGNDALEGSRAALANLDDRLGAFVIDFGAQFGPYFRPVFGAGRQTRVPRPRGLGGDEVQIATSFSEMCNEVPGQGSAAAMSSRSFCSLTGWCN